MLSISKCLWYNKSIFALRHKIVFDGKPKMTQNFEFEKLKSQILIFGHFNLGDFQFFKFNCFCHFWFPIEKIFLLKAHLLLSYQNIFWDDGVNREEDIL